MVSDAAEEADGVAYEVEDQWPAGESVLLIIIIIVERCLSVL